MVLHRDRAPDRHSRSDAPGESILSEIPRSRVSWAFLGAQAVPTFILPRARWREKRWGSNDLNGLNIFNDQLFSRRIHDFMKILNISLQIGAEFRAHDKIRPQCEFFVLAAHALHRASLTQRC